MTKGLNELKDYWTKVKRVTFDKGCCSNGTQGEVLGICSAWDKVYDLVMLQSSRTDDEHPAASHKCGH